MRKPGQISVAFDRVRSQFPAALAALMRPGALRHAGPILLFAGVWCLLLPEVIFHGLVYVGPNDRVLQDIPQLALASEALRKGTLPMWNAYSFCGAQLLGQPGLRLLYPPNLLVALLFPSSLPWAISWLVTLEIAAAMLVNYLLFLKVWDGDRACAAFSSLCVSLCTTSVLYIGGEVTNLLPPLILLALWDWPSRSLAANVALLTGALFLLFSGSWALLIVYSVLFCFAVSVARCAWTGREAFAAAWEGESRGDWVLRWAAWARPLATLIGLWLAAGMLAVMLTSLTWLPLLQDRASSFRRSMGYAEVSALWGQPWYMLLRIALPHFLGNFENWPVLERNLEFGIVDAFGAYAGAAALLYCLIAARGPRLAASKAWLPLRRAQYAEKLSPGAFQARLHKVSPAG